MLAFAPLAALASCLLLVQAAPMPHEDHRGGHFHRSKTEAATSTEAAQATTTTQAAQATATSSSSTTGTYSGDATYFLQGGVAGACGTVHADSDKVVAVPYAIWGTSDSEASSNCGRTINIYRTSDGATTTALVADLCPTCDGTYSIDLSVGAFTSIATEDEGDVAVTWSFA